ncbi:MAG: NAD(P)/FAD-dependent oxidoreductase [Chloroflexota bacterium]|nr:NAD(P)/FAD-dependent oxidoreductase [Chloroflexota bacterium]
MGHRILYDSLIVGGGPAGLTAALQLARFNRHPAIFDSGMGRSTYHQINHNYLGFPGGIHARELRELGREQVRAYPVVFVDEAVVEVWRDGELFVAQVESGEEFLGQTIVFATGVRDHFPHFPNWEEFVGRSFFWCITCDGYKTRGKHIVVLGNDDDAGVTAMQFLQYTRRITFLTNSPTCGISTKVQRALEEQEIPIVVGEIGRIDGYDGIIGQIVLKDGRCVDLDYLFNLQGKTPNSELAQQIGVEVDEHGYIQTDVDLHTNIPGALAAGDVTRLFAHQIATAVHEGITAACAANYYLYEPWQRHESYEEREARQAEVEEVA